MSYQLGWQAEGRCIRRGWASAVLVLAVLVVSVSTSSVPAAVCLANGKTCGPNNAVNDRLCCPGSICGGLGNVCQPGCRIAGVAYRSGAINPANPCQVCQPATSTTIWSSAPNGTACSDNNACTSGDSCRAGACVGGSNPCLHGGVCHGSVGGPACTCASGYTGAVCAIDIDECATNNGGCSSHATCTNTPGSFSCACNAGYVGDGVSCTPFAWHDGDFVTYSQTDWNEEHLAPGQLLVSRFLDVYPSAVLDIGITTPGGFSNTFTGPFAVIDYLTTVGPSGPLEAHLLDPSQSAGGAFAGDVLALRLVVDFSDAGFLPGASSTHFGDLKLCAFPTLPALQGRSVREFLVMVNTLLGGGSGVYSISDLDGITSSLTFAFRGGTVSAFAQDHLAVGACP